MEQITIKKKIDKNGLYYELFWQKIQRTETEEMIGNPGNISR